MFVFTGECEEGVESLTSAGTSTHRIIGSFSSQTQTYEASSEAQVFVVSLFYTVNGFDRPIVRWLAHQHKTKQRNADVKEIIQGSSPRLSLDTVSCSV